MASDRTEKLEMKAEWPDTDSDNIKVPFTTQMRKNTRTIHNLSDQLVNLKLGVACSNDQVWAEGLLLFYEIFKNLEIYLDECQDSLLGDLDLAGMRRTTAFEKDLDFYLGKDWKSNYKMRQEVKDYVNHLQEIKEQNPYLLIAYIYHLYMGLFSGGQILQKKRQILICDSEDENGYNVTHFDSRTIESLKSEMRKKINIVAEDLDEETKKEILKEGIKVFELNNSVIKTIPGVNEIFIRRLVIVLSILFVIFALILKLFFF